MTMPDFSLLGAHDPITTPPPPSFLSDLRLPFSTALKHLWDIHPPFYTPTHILKLKQKSISRQYVYGYLACVNYANKCNSRITCSRNCTLGWTQLNSELAIIRKANDHHSQILSSRSTLCTEHGLGVFYLSILITLVMFRLTL
jgi:hypothetical protein